MINKNRVQTKRLPNAKKGIAYLLLTLVFIIISLLSLYFVYHHIGERSLFVSLAPFSQTIFFPLILLLGLFFLLDGTRLFYILKTLNEKVAFRYIFKLVFINIFISNITPFATGGGFAQVYFLNKHGVSVGSAAAATTIRTVLAMGFFFLATPLVILFEKNLRSALPGEQLLYYAFLVSFLYFLIMYMIIKKRRVVKKLVYVFLRFLKRNRLISAPRFKKSVFRFFKETDAFFFNIRLFLSGNPKNRYLSVLFTLLHLLSLFLFSVILIYGLGYRISPLTIISFQIVITFIMYFAPTPGAAGIAEGGFALLFSFFVKKSDIVSLTFAWRFFTVYIGLIIGAIIFYKEILLKHGKT